MVHRSNSSGKLPSFMEHTDFSIYILQGIFPKGIIILKFGEVMYAEAIRVLRNNEEVCLTLE